MKSRKWTDVGCNALKFLSFQANDFLFTAKDFLRHNDLCFKANKFFHRTGDSGFTDSNFFSYN